MNYSTDPLNHEAIIAKANSLNYTAEEFLEMLYLSLFSADSGAYNPLAFGGFNHLQAHEGLLVALHKLGQVELVKKLCANTLLVDIMPELHESMKNWGRAAATKVVRKKKAES